MRNASSRAKVKVCNSVQVGRLPHQRHWWPVLERRADREDERGPVVLACFDKCADSSLRLVRLRVDRHRAKAIPVVMTDIDLLGLSEALAAGKPRQPGPAIFSE
jgi:hypothetical protein